MFKSLVVIIVLIIYPSVIFTQSNLSDLQKQLPKSVQENPGLLKQITLTLQRDFSLNPELVAYRITYYKKLFDQGIQDNDLNGLNNLRMITIEYYQKRNKWIDKEKEIIEKTSYSSEYKIKAINFISGFYIEIKDTNGKADYYLDQNFVDYYSAIALGTQNLGEYNFNVDYTKSKNAIEKIIRDSRIERVASIGTKDQELEPIVDLLNYWYLFSNDNQSNDFVVSDLLLKYFESEYNLNDFPLNEIFIGINFFQIKEHLDIKSSGNIIPNDLIIGDVKNSTQLNLSFNYKIMMNDNLKPFSFFTLGFGAGISLDAKTDLKNNIVVYQKDPLQNSDFVSQTWNVNELISKDPFRASIYFKGTTPVLFFNKNLFIQLGLISGINFSSYKLQYDYSYDKVQVLWDQNIQRFVSTLLERKIGEQDAEENNQTKFFIYPTIDLSLYSINPILLQFSVGYNFISAKIGYGI